MAHTDKTIRNAKTGQQIRFVQTSGTTNGQLLEMEATFRARSAKPVDHYHPNQVEDFTVVAGQLTVQIGGQTRTLQSGDALHVPRNTVHAMWNASDSETIVNWQVRPALYTEFFFETAFGLANEDKSTPEGMPPLLQRALLAQHFSAVFRLANPPRVVQQLVFGILSPLAYLAGYRPTYRKYLS